MGAWQGCRTWGADRRYARCRDPAPPSATATSPRSAPADSASASSYSPGPPQHGVLHEKSLSPAWGERLSLHRVMAGGGPEGIRTPDLLHAMQTRSQLRHTPQCSPPAVARTHHRTGPLMIPHGRVATQATPAPHAGARDQDVRPSQRRHRSSSTDTPHGLKPDGFSGDVGPNGLG